MGEHGAEAGIGVIGGSGPYPAPEAAIESFQPAGGAEVKERPVGVTCVKGKLGDSGPKVTAQTGDRFGLGGAIETHHLMIAVEHSGEPFGLPNLVKVVENGFAPPPLFLAGEVFVRETDGVVKIAQLME